ncbi:ABC transporter substrate-binding protein [Wohlfahrtiimonas larvae]|uniref:Oligopeptide ABC transporter substrate-binding protein OppA n=3 Tax=Wohlfahrtiimonas larvae TaxID=1157986 RepID=A0ABP9ML70_9GAMM
MKPLIKQTLLATTLGFVFSATALAAIVPVGIELHPVQKLVKNNAAEPQSLDPHKMQGVPESNIARDQFEGLTIANLNGETIPGVAESWENDNGKVWRFTLRKDAKWSNGDPVTAHDFVYSWQRIVDPNTASPYASYLEYAHIENVNDIVAGKQSPETLGIKALDDHTLEVTLTESIPYLDKLVGHIVLAPVHRATVEKYGNQWTNPKNFVGNGAYRLKDWVVNERIVLERNPYYWDNDQTVINEVTLLPITSENSAVNRYRSGEIDMTQTIPVELFTRLKKELPNDVRITPYLCSYYYELNNQKPPFNDPRVRTALKLALDRDIIANKVVAQGQMPAYGFTPPYINDMDAIEPEWFKLTQKERNAMAVKLLEEAGYNKSKPLKFKLLYNTLESHRKVAIAAASILKQNAGIEMQLENQEWKTFLDNRQQGTYQVARAGWCADYNEPTTFLNIMLSKSSNNTAHYKSEAFDQVIKSAVTAKTVEERVKAYQKAEQILDQDSAILPIYYYVNSRLVKPHVGGYTGMDPLGNFYSKDMYIIKH